MAATRCWGEEVAVPPCCSLPPGQAPCLPGSARRTRRARRTLKRTAVQRPPRAPRPPRFHEREEHRLRRRGPLLSTEPEDTERHRGLPVQGSSLWPSVTSVVQTKSARPRASLSLESRNSSGQLSTEPLF